MQLQMISEISEAPTEAMVAATETVTPPETTLQRVMRAFRHRSLSIGLAICVVLVAVALAAPLLVSTSPSAQNPLQTFAPPSWAFPMGTDAFGRDLFARVLYGARTTMLASLCVVILGGLIGTTIGLVAGYFGGIFSFCAMRLIDLLLAFPGVLLALSVAAILGPGLGHGVFAIAAILVPVYARVVEGATAEVRNLSYVQAAVTLGAGPMWIIMRHILPNVMSSVIVLTTTWLGLASLWITALGFLGLGVQPPMPELGTILNDGQSYISIAWWITVFPGVYLSLFVIGTNLVGDGLRDEIDPMIARH